MNIDKELEMILYSTPDEDVTVSAIVKDETLWLNQKSMQSCLMLMFQL